MKGFRLGPPSSPPWRLCRLKRGVVGEAWSASSWREPCASQADAVQSFWLRYPKGSRHDWQMLHGQRRIEKLLRWGEWHTKPPEQRIAPPQFHEKIPLRKGLLTTNRKEAFFLPAYSFSWTRLVLLLNSLQFHNSTCSQLPTVTWAHAVSVLIFGERRFASSVSVFAFPKNFEQFHAPLPRRR